LTLFFLAHCWLKSLVCGNVSKPKLVFNLFWPTIGFIFGLWGTVCKLGPTLPQKKKVSWWWSDSEDKLKEVQFIPSVCGGVLQNKEPLQYIKNISLISSPIYFLIFLHDFLNIFHFNIYWLRAMISRMCFPLLAYIFWNQKH
jgi:hypothetical protein